MPDSLRELAEHCLHVASNPQWEATDKDAGCYEFQTVELARKLEPLARALQQAMSLLEEKCHQNVLADASYETYGLCGANGKLCQPCQRKAALLKQWNETDSQTDEVKR